GRAFFSAIARAFQGAGFNCPEQLGRYCDGDGCRQLAVYAIHPDGAGDAGDLLRRESLAFHAVPELGRLGLGTDEARPGEIASSEQRLADVVVEIMAVGEDNVEGPGWRVLCLVGWRVTHKHRHIVRQLAGE